MQSAVEAFMRAGGLGRKSADWRAMDAWRKALGGNLVRRARPVRFHKGELTVEVDSAAHLQELASFTGEGFRAAANRSLGEAETIRRVTYKLKR